MRWWHHAFFSSSPSSSSSSPKSPRSQYRQQQQRRLTRVRKLRHLQDRDIAGVAVLPKSTSESLVHSRSTSLDNSRWQTSSSAQPQPLPLPDFSLILRGVGYSKNSNSGDLPLPSPKEGSTGEGAASNAAIGRITYQDARKSTGHDDTRSTGKVPRDLKGEHGTRDNFWLNVPVRSAPTSPFSSPALSPQRMRTRDMFLSRSMAPQGFNVWSAPEMPMPDGYAVFPSQASPERIMLSPDGSPLHSPAVRSPRCNPRSPSQPASPLHNKLSIETSTARRESNGHINVHPLPLPPGASMPSQSAPVPQVIAKPELLPMTSQWQKGKFIGRGTFGSVYVATNRETGALCAMKEVELLPDDPKSAESIKQLEQEITVLSHLKHSNIVQYYGSEIVGDRFYIYLEYVYPGSINKYVHEHCGGAITESIVRCFTRHILSGLAYLHSKRTIHRDIKGANLLVDASGVVKLADFGMAKHLTGQAADLSLKGSPYWMAPELLQAVMQKDNNSDLALAVDIWSLGCTIIEMLNGKPPWSEYEGAAAMFKVMRESPPIPESLSSEGKDFLRCCFLRNPAERPSASMLLEHRFLKNSQHLDVPSCTQALNGMKLTDKANSPREWSNYTHDQLQTYPSPQTTKGKVAPDSETAQQSHPKTSDLTVASHHSPRSTLEALPSLSPPRSGQSTRLPLPPANAYSCINHGAKKNHIFH